MRADFFSRTILSGRLAALTLIALAATGCKTEKGPDQPTLVGAPAPTAYLGVEYYYNWGAYGGESILDYSLVNAPSWLALEDTSNKARQGIIMRGVPGLSGGNRGDADLGKHENIEILGTDGRMAGFLPFDIEVKRNVLSVEPSEFTEGESLKLETQEENACVMPDLKSAGQHTFDLNIYDENGELDTVKTITRTTRRVLAKVELDQPSVTQIVVAFQLDSDFNPDNCDASFSKPHQRCEYSTSNTGRAIVGQDIVIRGSDSAAPADKNGKVLSYLKYDENVYDKGVLILEPGITECYIPLEVVDDNIPESNELANIRLTEVRKGIAALGSNDTEVKAGITIVDNEPVVSVQTLNGGNKDAINADADPGAGIEGSLTNYKAVLTGERDGPVSVRFSEQGEGAGARLGVQYEIVGPDDVTVSELTFPVDKNEIEFSLRGISYDVDPDDGFDDLFLHLSVDDAYQAGREGYARGEADTLLRVNLNRLIAPQIFTDFTPTDIELGHDNRLFVAGYTDTDIEVRIFDQAGGILQTMTVAPGTTNTDVYIHAADRLDTTVTPRVTYHELAVGFSAPGAIGGEDVHMALYRFKEVPPAPGAYEFVWEHEVGSKSDDFVRWIGLGSEGSKPLVILAGDTTGDWGDQNVSGSSDVFLVEIEEKDGAPSQKAVRLIGSSRTDVLVGGGFNASTPVLFGNAQVTIDGSGSVGPFFASGRATSALKPVQVGADQSELLKHGVFGAGSAWLVGDAQGISYSITEVEDEDNELTRDYDLNSPAGFVWGFSTAGVPNAAYQVNDYADTSKETLSRSVLFDGDVVVAGNTNGQLKKRSESATDNDGVLARRSSEDDAAYRHWGKQLPYNMTFLDLANFRDDEVLALVEVAGIRQLLVFSPEGKLLTPIAP